MRTMRTFQAAYEINPLDFGIYFGKIKMISQPVIEYLLEVFDDNCH